MDTPSIRILSIFKPETSFSWWEKWDSIQGASLSDININVLHHINRLWDRNRRWTLYFPLHYENPPFNHATHMMALAYQKKKIMTSWAKWRFISSQVAISQLESDTPRDKKSEKCYKHACLAIPILIIMEPFWKHAKRNLYRFMSHWCRGFWFNFWRLLDWCFLPVLSPNFQIFRITVSKARSNFVWIALHKSIYSRLLSPSKERQRFDLLPQKCNVFGKC